MDLPDLATCYFSALIISSSPLSHPALAIGPHFSSNMAGTLVPQDLCTCQFLYWEDIVPDIHKTNSLVSFKLQLKCHLFSEDFPDHFM